VLTGRDRRRLLFAALGYFVFVVYGSLVPLHFRPVPLDDAWERFEAIPYLNLGIASRADWVANILLFVPLAFLWLGVLWPHRGRFARTLASCIVLAACAASSLVIEFTQVFFPPRTVSMNDLVAESLGAIVGIVLWWTTGQRIVGWLNGWAATRTRTGTPAYLLTAYLALVFGYNLMPLDLTISVVEIWHKWGEGKLLLVPFSATYESGAEQIYALLSDTVIWVPAALLWKLASTRSATSVVLRVVACAALIEFLQLFVYSRVTATTDVILAAVGATIGVLGARWFRPASSDATAAHCDAAPRPPTLVWVVALAGWFGVLVVVFWYPFDFRTDWGFVHERLTALRRAPFEAYYYGSEFRALTELLHKTGFFFPLGALLALLGSRIRTAVPMPGAVIHVAALAVIAGTAAAIEAGQVILPTKNADTTDWLLEVVGGLAGYLFIRVARPIWATADGRR
jgi:glycopeptide antibiotics resistance protein